MNGSPSEETRIALLEARVKELESWRERWVDPRIEKLENFKSLVLTVGGCIGAAIGFLSAEIKRRLGMG